MSDSRHGARQRRCRRRHLHAVITPRPAAAAAGVIVHDDALVRRRLDRLPQPQTVPATLSRRRRQ